MKNIYKRFANSIALNCKVDDVYLAVLQYKFEYLLSNPDFVDTLYMPEKELKQFYQLEKHLTKMGITDPVERRKYMLEVAEANYFGVLIKVGDRIFDLFHQTYIDFNQLRIVKYDNLGKYYSEGEFRTVMALPGECPFTKEPSVSVQLKDWGMFHMYQKSIESSQGSADITDKFKKEIGLDKDITRN